jgi:two-component system, cell cycle sensor histidine kinase and response regulator CckA
MSLSPENPALQASVVDPGLFRQIFDMSTDACFLLDCLPGGGYAYVALNTAGERFLNSSLSQIRNIPLERLLPPDLAAYFNGRCRQCLDAEEPITYDEEVHLPSGKAHFSTSLIPLKGEAGKVTQIAGVCRDVTQRVREEERRQESQKLESLGLLAGGVAHDFNNALALILGNVDLARQDVGPGHPALVSLEEIGKASRRAKELVQQILAFGRRQKLERKATSLALVVVETARMVRATLPAMVSLNVVCEGDAPAVLADATQIKQILLNLCSNAMQAIQDQERPGVIDIRLDAYEHAQGGARGDLHPGRYARLTVRDSGPGMDNATRTRIFEPFFTTKPKGKGTGLGLSVVHGIVQAHEAVMEVKSTPGEGTTFHIYFPAIDPLGEEIAEPAPDAATVHAAGKHVLYLDDEEAIVFLMTRLLKRRGYRVSGYTDPREALAAVRANHDQFDLAVTDHNMPGMSGLEVVRALREIRPDLPVVLASGYINEDFREQALADGVRELIHKPDTVDDLCEAVARFANALSQKDGCS